MTIDALERSPEVIAARVVFARELGCTINELRLECPGTRHLMTDDEGEPLLDPQGNQRIRIEPCTAGPGGGPYVHVTTAAKCPAHGTSVA
jgi:hypothetical protein